ncbi:MAG TPA: SusC/RagA family TonB-linked outer membrane protein [Draconibacterium sp.]|nr:SusC/RagA family TonB-linked outer membrane protein [Draconibacterium sp.]
MKLTLILTLLVFVSFGNSFSQVKLSLQLRNATIQEVIESIEEKTDYVFLYRDEIFDQNQRYSVNFDKTSFEKVLNSISEKANVTYEIRDERQIILKEKVKNVESLTPQQQRTITGIVTDQNGEPMPGVSVLVKGTTVGTVTGSEGQFTLQIPPDAETLQFSFIGFKAMEVEISSQSTYNIVMEEAAYGLDEVVVVGYGTQKKSDITGTVASLPQERLEMMPNLNIAQAIQGAMPGVLVETNTSGANPDQTILVRGRNSITANNDPLLIVDGIPYGGNLSDINPNDILSIEVLKDASAAAIYGSRGANGVILISTKQGTAGKTVISYDGKYSVTDVTKVSRQLTGPEFYDFKITRNPEAMTLSEEEVYKNGTWTNWTDLALRMGQTQEHNISVSGGSDKTKFYFGGGYLNIKGVAKNDDFERISTRINLETKVTDWLTVGTRSQFTIDDASGSEANFEVALETNPLGTAYDKYGNLTIYPWPDNIIVGNPLGPLLYDDLNKTYQVVANNYAEINFPFIQGLTYRLNTGMRFRFRDRANYQPRTTQSGIADLGDGSVDNSVSNNTVVENILSYNRDFGDHTLFVTALYSYEGNNSRTNSADATKYPNDFLSWYGSGQATNRELSYSFYETALISQMLRLNYSYSSRYLATFTVRRDGYSGFGADNKWGIFPSAALGWNLANEDFFTWKKIFSELKLRGSYGVNGNQAINPYQSLSQFVVANYSAGTETVIGYKPGRLGVSNLGWESSKTLNLGLDFGLLKNRISGTFNWYLTKTSDLLLERSISVIHGVTPVTHLDGTGLGYGNHWVHPAVTENIGKTQNNGIEFSVNSRNIITGNFKWSTTGNISYNKNKIVSLYGFLDENGKEVDDISNSWFIGQPIRVNYDYVWDGVWQLDEADEAAEYGQKPGFAKLKDTNGDGELSGDDRQIIGQTDPKIIWGLNNTFNYGRFTLNIFMHGLHGRTTMDYLMNDHVQGAEVRYNTMKKNWWTPDNPTNEWVKNEELADQMEGHNANRYYSSDYVRVKDISLSYDLPESVLDKIGIKNLRLYFTGRNLFTITKWPGMDPDLVDEDSQQDIPMQKEYVFGLNLGF